MKKSQLQWVPLALLLVLLIFGCKPGDEKQEEVADTPKKEVKVPAFNADTAYAFVERQLAFGPRVPGTDAHKACQEWMMSELERFGAVVTRQEFTARYFTGESVRAANIIGAFNPKQARRIILAAHYDTRAIADQEEDPALRKTPIPGADDGASGVAVLLEIARLLKNNPVDVGVDIIFFDAEDQGESEADNNMSWCLGAQYWAKNPHTSNYKAQIGILLDMVGARNAVFPQEDVSGLYAHASQTQQLYNKVWRLAKAMGKGKYFGDHVVRGIIDDHYFVNLYAGIPMIDIVHKPMNASHGFGPHWHTHADDINIIDRKTLGAAGQVTTAVVYRFDGGKF
jgi:hypothetical protein